MTANRIIYASSETCADLWYLSGFSAPDPFLYLEVQGEAYIWVSALEIGRASKEARSDVHVCSKEDLQRRFGLPVEPDMTMAALISNIGKAAKVERWDVPEEFPFGLAERLRKAGCNLDCAGTFAPQRAVKTAREVAAIQEAIGMTEAGLQRAVNILREATIAADGNLQWEGAVLRAEQLASEINIAIARQGGTAAGTICAPGPQGADPHCQGEGPIQAHVPIVIDVFPRSNRTGYFGDLTRTLLKGTPSAEVQRAYDVVQAAQDRAIKMLKPGIPGETVHRMVADYFTAQGFPTDLKAVPARGFFHGLGHGIGLEIHEEPTLSTRGSGKTPLVPGHIVTVEPGVYYPEWGGIRIEDDVLITEDGCEVLSHFPHFLVV